MESLEFVVGQRWISHSDTDLGLGIVTDLSGRRVTLGFPAADEERTYAVDNAPLSRIIFRRDETIELFDGSRLTVLDATETDGVLMYRAEDEAGQQHQVSELKLSGTVSFSAPHQRMFAGQFDRNGAFRLRAATLQHLDRLGRSRVHGLVGARTQHLPHQVYIAHQVATRYAPRVLLADEVGLGKTIEAGLILHFQRHTGRAKRILVVVPDSLVHQWLVEMLRRFNLRFSIVNGNAYSEPTDDNPFEREQLILCSMGTLMSQERAQTDCLNADWDLLVVDEAHHLTWSPEAASPEYQVIERLAENVRGLLLLTATPEQMGVASHFARLRLLDRDRFPSLEGFEKEEAHYQAVTDVLRSLSAKGEDLPLTPDQCDQLRPWLGDSLQSLLSADEPVKAIREALLDRHGTGRMLFRNTRAAIQGFPRRICQPTALPCPDLYEDVKLGERGISPETAVAEEDWLVSDPRVQWLKKTLSSLRPEKVVVICANANTAMALESHLQLREGIRSAAFHEHLSLIERDRAAAYFADREQGAQALICSEIGSEGRNFQFASHLILFDLPANPDLLEQRIGRLDRIGQQKDIVIHVPYLEGTSQEVAFRWYHEGLNAFEKSCAVGVSVQEAVSELWQKALTAGPAHLDVLIERTAAVAREWNRKLEAGRDLLIEMNSCRPDVAAELISEIEQDEKPDAVREYMFEAFDILGVDVEDHSEHADILKPGEQFQAGYLDELPEDGITVTWDREVALQREDLSFLSWEHPWVSGLMESVASSGLGKAALATMNVKALPAGTLLLEAIFVTHCPAPESLELSRYLPSSPLRLLVNLEGRNLSDALPHDRLNDLCSNIRRRTAQSIVPQIREQVEAMVEHAKGLANPRLNELKAEATRAVEKLLQPEIDRLRALHQVNPAVRTEEIDYFEGQLTASKEAIAQASLSLEGIRVIVTA